MVLESTMICFDNSDYQRNGDYFPTRLDVQKDGVNLICLTKTRANPENNVGLITIANSVEVLATLTSEVGRIFTRMHAVQPKGEINLLTGIRIAHLVLKHRIGRNHKMRIVVFVGSPIKTEEKALVNLAKKLKKEKVNVDFVSFGDHEKNIEMLTSFISALNGKDGSGSHLLSVPRGAELADALLSSPIIQGEDGLGGAGFEFGVDPNVDPELALALRVSMEEERQKLDEEQRRALEDLNEHSSAGDEDSGEFAKKSADSSLSSINEQNAEEAMLQRALDMSSDFDEDMPDFANMTEDEQIVYAMQMSMQNSEDFERKPSKAAKPNEGATVDVNEEYCEIIGDPALLQSVLETLPGVDVDAVRNALGLQRKDKKEGSGDKSDKK